MNAPSTPSSSPLVRVLHLFTLCAFAFTQPLLTALEKQPVYLHDQQFSEIEIGVFFVALLLVLPLAFVGLDWLAQKVSWKCRGYGRNSVPFFLITLLLLSMVRPYSGHWWYWLYGTSGLLILIVVLPCAWWLTMLYERSSGLRFWLSLTSIGLIVFPGMFVWNWHRDHVAATTAKPGLNVGNPVPVVFVIFDEFSGTTLMTPTAELDQARFPQFGRLAAMSTWYRNATTVSPRTDVAVPAVLSGNYPVTPPPPLAANYPGNLFELIEASRAYDMKIFEPVSRLCPESINEEPQFERDHWKQSLELVHTMAAVYPRLIFTNDTPVWFPRIPREWFGAHLGVDHGPAHFQSTLPGLFQYSGTDLRHQQQRHLLRSLKNTEKPEFCFFHTVYPHYPWSFLPSGTQYQSELTAPRIPVGARGDLGEDWDNDPATVLRNEFRYRLQAGDADRFIGQLLDRLEEVGLLDRCLLIVTADHGVSFRPGHSRRIPDAESLPDIFSVPLFIKYPAQKEGHQDDRNIELIDLFPTIAELIELEIPQPIDGLAISSNPRRPRKSLYFETNMTIVEPDFPQRASSLQRQEATFGTTRLDELPQLAYSRPEWHGRSVSEFSIDDRTVPAMQRELQHKREANDMVYETMIEPRLVAGYFLGENLPVTPVQIALAIDGVILDTGKSFMTERNQVGFEFLIPESLVPGPVGAVQLYVVDFTKPTPQLRPVKIVDTFW